jgi:UDP-glucose 4-epimerase
MKIAITGASGFIGRKIVEVANFRGHELSCPPRRVLWSTDLWRDFAGVDVVCHLAAHIPVHMADRHPETFRECFEANVLLTSRILRAAELAGVRRFVNFGSGNAYAVRQDYPGESAPLYPTSRGTPYLASKVAQETIVASWAGLQTCTLRLASVYGPGQWGGMLAHLTKRLLHGDTVVLEHGGAYGADYVSVHDVARVAVDACESSATGPFNIGSGRRTTIQVLADIIRGAAGTGEIIVKPTDRPRFIGFPALNIGRASRELGFSSQLLLLDGLTEYVEWMRANGDTNAKVSQEASCD